MSPFAIIVFLVIGVPLLAFAVWQLLQEGLVRIDSGSVGLLIVRGKVSDRVLTPGSHFVFPFRHQMIQGYPLRELTYLTDDASNPDELDFSDPPLRARFGDRTVVTVHYTIRFRLRPDALAKIHERVGPDGLKRLVRDESRRVIIDELASDRYSIDDSFGAARDKLEQRLTDRLTEVFHEDGFDVGMFNLRAIDLGTIDDVIADTVRAKAELELESADAKVRQLRVEHEAASAAQLGSSLTDSVLRYRQIELGREALQRWDGRIVVGDTAVRRAVTSAVAPADADATVPDAVEPSLDAEATAAEPDTAP